MNLLKKNWNYCSKASSKRYKRTIMKNILKQKAAFLTVIFAMLSAGIAYSQPIGCPDNLGQNIGSRVSGHSNTGQSFTAPGPAGLITAVTVVYNELPTAGTNSNDRVLNIRDGALCTSPILHSQVIPVGSIVVGSNTFILTSPVPINALEVNSWEITDAGQNSDAAHGVAHNTGGAYTGGNSWYSCGQLLTFDATFNVSITNGCGGIAGPPPSAGGEIPTVSEWGLIFLFLSFLVAAGAWMYSRKRKEAMA